MTNGARTSRKNEEKVDKLGTINKTNRTGSTPNLKRNALASIENGQVVNVSTVPASSSTAGASPTAMSVGAFQQSTSLKQAATAAAANSKATKELLEAIQTKVCFISERQDELIARAQILSERHDRYDLAQLENKAALDKIIELVTRLNVAQPIPNAPRSRHFSDDAIEKAAEIDLDLTKPLYWDGPAGKVKLMEIPFNNLNGNLFGTKAMSKIFSKTEMAEGYVEPADNQTQFEAIDQERIDLIKRCYIKKLDGDVDKFIEMWSNVRSALRQKCRDVRRSLDGDSVVSRNPAPDNGEGRDGNADAENSSEDE